MPTTTAATATAARFHEARLVVSFAPGGRGGTLLTIDTSIDLEAYAGTPWTPPSIAEGWTKGWQDNLDGLGVWLSQLAGTERPAAVARSETTPPPSAASKPSSAISAE